MTTNTRAVIEQPEGWLDLQNWFEANEDPLRPWNVSAISRKIRLPQSVVRALLRGPKDSPGMSRAAFTIKRLRIFHRLFKAYGYRPLSKPVPNAGPTCRAIGVEHTIVRPVSQ